MTKWLASETLDECHAAHAAPLRSGTASSLGWHGNPTPVQLNVGSVPVERVTKLRVPTRKILVLLVDGRNLASELFQHDVGDLLANLLGSLIDDLRGRRFELTNEARFHRSHLTAKRGDLLVEITAERGHCRIEITAQRGHHIANRGHHLIEIVLGNWITHALERYGNRRPAARQSSAVNVDSASLVITIQCCSSPRHREAPSRGPRHWRANL